MSYNEADVIALAVEVNRAAAYRRDRSNEAVEASRKLKDAHEEYERIADEWRKASRELHGTDREENE